MTTAYFEEIQIREVICISRLFQFQICNFAKEHFIKGTKRRSSYKEHIENALAPNADEGRD